MSLIGIKIGDLRLTEARLLKIEASSERFHGCIIHLISNIFWGYPQNPGDPEVNLHLPLLGKGTNNPTCICHFMASSSNHTHFLEVNIIQDNVYLQKIATL